MNAILSNYSVNETTWFYLSFLLIIAVFFRFGRVWSIRNIDLALLLSLTPGLLMVDAHNTSGYIWLFVVSGLLFARLICDPLFQRRPLMEQNMNVAGMTFLCISAFGFLVTKVITEPLNAGTVESVRRSQQMIKMEDSSEGNAENKMTSGPTSSIIAAPMVPVANAVATGNGENPDHSRGIEDITARVLAVFAHSAVIVGLVVLGMKLFGHLHIGLAMATLYLLLPCTALDVHKVNHVLPTAFIIWALVAYRRPLISGSMMGLACGTLFFPVFLLPLWTMFYGWKGGMKFVGSLLVVGAVLLSSLLLVSADTNSFVHQTVGSIDWSILSFRGGETAGFWSLYNSAYRLPVFVAFLLLLAVLTFWPWKKNFEDLLAHSTAIILAIQFWYPHQGGIYVLWYLPLLLLVVFRPRLNQLVPPGQKSKQVAPSIAAKGALNPRVANRPNATTPLSR